MTLCMYLCTVLIEESFIASNTPVQWIAMYWGCVLIDFFLSLNMSANDLFRNFAYKNTHIATQTKGKNQEKCQSLSNFSSANFPIF